MRKALHQKVLFFTSLKFKLLIMTGLTVCCLVGGLLFYYSRQFYHFLLEDRDELLTYQFNLIIEHLKPKLFDPLAELSQGIKTCFSSETEVQETFNQLTQNILANNEEFQSLYFYFLPFKYALFKERNEGVIEKAVKVYEKDLTFSIEKRLDYFINKQPITDPGSLTEVKPGIISIFLPLYIEGDLKGVVGLAIERKKWIAMLEREAPYKAVEFLLYNEKKEEFITSHSLQKNEDLKDVKYYKTVLKLVRESNNPRLVFNPFKKVPYYWLRQKSTFLNCQWFMGITQREAMRSIQLFIWKMVGVGLFGLLITLAALVGIASFSTRNIKKVLKVMNSVEQGKMQIDERFVYWDEYGYLMRTFKKIIGRFSRMIKSYRERELEVHDSIGKIGEILETNQSQVTDFQKAMLKDAQMAKSLKKRADEFMSEMEKTYQQQTRLNELLEKESKEIADFNENVKKLDFLSEALYTQFNLVSNKAINIKSIVKSFTKVTDQINLLALNGAIEAKKAGQHGNGFSILVKEIQRLSYQTAEIAVYTEQSVLGMEKAIQGAMEQLLELQTVAKKENDLNAERIQWNYQCKERARLLGEKIHLLTHVALEGIQELPQEQKYEQMTEDLYNRFVGPLKDCRMLTAKIKNAVSLLDKEITYYKL